MKLIHVKLHNFRAVLDQEFSLKDYGLLVGPNNSGKSTVIDAIRAVYEKDGFKFRGTDDFPRITVQDNESWVELQFALNDAEHDSLADTYKTPEKKLRLRKYLQTDAKTHDIKSTAGFIFGYKTDGSLSKEPFYGAKNVQSGKIGDLIYIPAISKVDEHAKLSGPSALRDLLTDIMSDVVKSGKAYADFSSSVEAFSTSIRTEETSDRRSLAGFESDLNDLLRPWQAEFNLTFPPPSAAEIIKTMLGWYLVDEFHGKPQDIDYYGSGFQRNFIYSLIQLGARYAGKKSSKKAKDFTPSMNLILFEEPEAFLHPPQQEVLARSLKTLANTPDWQVLCATHSSHFVSKNAADIPAITRLHREAGNVELFQVGGEDWKAIVDANQAINAIAERYPKMKKRLHKDDAKPEMEAVKHFLWLNPDRASLFFADHVLLVEGPSEVAFINKLIGEGRIKSADCGMYVLDCIGKWNTHRFMNLLSKMGISHAVVHDDDDDKDEHEEINKLIQDSAHAVLTLKVERIKGKLEALLGVPDAGADYRKPQHLLYYYDAGKIDPDKIARFCTAVERCIPKRESVSAANVAAPSVRGQ